MELQTYRVQGQLLAVQDRRDHDLHILLADPEDPKSRLIAEIPDPPCSMGSTHEDDFASARRVAESLRGMTGSRELVEVTGVAFFDFAHIQRGRAHNGVELHPVLSLTDIAAPVR
jgi:hypothetical protein